MKKKLPGVFPGKVSGEAGNNTRLAYVDKEEEVVSESLDSVKGININQKISQIFNSSNYVYKADVKIKLKSGNTLNKRIIGKNNIHLITMDNELIPITDIVDIKRNEL